MAYNLSNKKKLNNFLVNGYCFQITAENASCAFYIWNDENASLSDRAVEINRINVNLSENNYRSLCIDIADHICVAKQNDYIVFKSSSSSTYIILSAVVNKDLHGEFEIKNSSFKAVNCMFADNQVKYSIKETRMNTDKACILDIWIITPKGTHDILNEILENICI